MGMSLDGHTVMPGGSWPTSYKEDWRRMNRLRDWSDVVIVTRSTIIADNPNLFVRDKPNKKWQPQPVILLQNVDKDLDRDLRVFQRPHPKPMLVTIGDNQQGEEFKNFKSIKCLIDEFESMGKRKILLETGPRASGMFLQNGSIDEVYITLLPFAIGGHTTDRAFVTDDFLAREQFKIRSVQRRSNLLFLRYIRS
jgi:riboflavin biosynthesis pyrimidine reductase